jgi:hypothetical protein
MAEAKIGAALPKGDGDGLSSIAHDLVRDPTRLRVIMCIIDTKKVTTDFDTGDVTPVVRLRRVEVVRPEDLPAAEQLMRRALEGRSGGTVLPLELEDEMREAFRDIDTSTGEIRNGGDS